MSWGKDDRDKGVGLKGRAWPGALGEVAGRGFYTEDQWLRVQRAVAATGPPWMVSGREPLE